MTAIVQGGQQRAARIKGPMRNWEKTGGFSQNNLRGRYPGGSGDGNTAVHLTDSGTDQGHYAED